MFMLPKTEFGFPSEFVNEDEKSAEPRFSVIEYHSFYAVRDNNTDEEHPMSDGVDQSETFAIGTEEFRQEWENNLNANPGETEEAYFPKQTEEKAWFARLSADGYLDCTDWIGPFETETEAIKELFDQHGDDCETIDDVCQYAIQFADFWRGYTQAIGFTAHDDSESGESLFSGSGDFDSNHPDCADEYLDKLTEDERKELLNDASGFFFDNLADIVDNAEQAGHDFHLTRNHHGCGFWDGDWTDEVEQRLTESSKTYGSCELMGKLDEDGGIKSAQIIH